MPSKTYTDKENEFIEANYLLYPVKMLARMMNRSACFVKSRMTALNLVVPADIIQNRKIESRFKKGSISYNKGLKQHQYMSPECIEKTKSTRFKKGNRPHNEKESDGIITIRHSKKTDSNPYPYKFIRLAKGKWYPYHQYLFEQHFGKVEKDKCVVFKDGDTLNCSLENLELVSRKELLERNAGRNKLSDDYLARIIVGNRYADKTLVPLVKADPEILKIKKHQLLLRKEIKKHEH